MVIIEGASPRPVWLWINDDEVELRDAGHLWGRSVWEVEPAIKAELQDPSVKIASIGRAGENRVRPASIVNDLHRAAGRSGVGAVMGSKNLKAIAARGSAGGPGQRSRSLHGGRCGSEEEPSAASFTGAPCPLRDPRHARHDARIWQSADPQ